MTWRVTPNLGEAAAVVGGRAGGAVGARADAGGAGGAGGGGGALAGADAAPEPAPPAKTMILSCKPIGRLCAVSEAGAGLRVGEAAAAARAVVAGAPVACAFEAPAPPPPARNVILSCKSIGRLCAVGGAGAGLRVGEAAAAARAVAAGAPVAGAFEAPAPPPPARNIILSCKSIGRLCAVAGASAGLRVGEAAAAARAVAADPPAGAPASALKAPAPPPPARNKILSCKSIGRLCAVGGAGAGLRVGEAAAAAARGAPVAGALEALAPPPPARNKILACKSIGRFCAVGGASTGLRVGAASTAARVVAAGEPAGAPAAALAGATEALGPPPPAKNKILSCKSIGRLCAVAGLGAISVRSVRGSNGCMPHHATSLCIGSVFFFFAGPPGAPVTRAKLLRPERWRAPARGRAHICMDGRFWRRAVSSWLITLDCDCA